MKTAFFPKQATRTQGCLRLKSTMTVVCLFFILMTGHTQEPDTLPSVKWNFSGYLSHLQTTVYQPAAGPVLMDGLLHQRLNIGIVPRKSPFRFHAGIRSRLFYGNIYQLNPGMRDGIHDQNNDYLPLSVNLLSNDHLLLNSYFDRLYAQWSGGRLEVRLGRQRINWGIGSLWNPNDLFNSFNFTDFDYAERPGADALRVTWFTGPASRLEGVVQMAESGENLTSAFLYRWNTGSFDMQVIGGKYKNDLTFGGGWSGYIEEVGFKGEFMYFTYIDGKNENTFNATAGLDYLIGSRLFVHGGYLYNGSGSTGAGQNLFSFRLSAKNLYPWRHALYAGGKYSFTPLFSGGLTAVYSPVESRPFFFSPDLSYNVGTDWDLDLISQIFMTKKPAGSVDMNIYAFFLRVKWSF